MTKDERIERLLLKADRYLALDAPNLARDALYEAREALADDGAGGGKTPCPKHTKGNGPCYCEPSDTSPTGTDARKKAFGLLDTLTVIAMTSTETGATEKEIRMMSAGVRRALTEPAVPSAVRKVMDELQRARTKFPQWPDDPIHAATVVSEEAGELAQAALQSVYEPHKQCSMHDEAVQTAAMAIRFLENMPQYEMPSTPQHEDRSVAQHSEPGRADEPEYLEIPRFLRRGDD